MDGKSESRAFFDDVSALMAQFRANFDGFLGSPGNGYIKTIKTITPKVQELCHIDADALLAALQIDDITPYHIVQPMHTAVICELLAFRKGLPKEERLSLIAGALTHDIGMGELNQALQNQLVPLSEKQRELLRKHPEQGAEILKTFGISDPIWLDTVTHHHERLDGGGYPHQLAGENISVGARILSLADVYTAMIKPKPYRDAVPPVNALRDLFIHRNEQTDNELTQLLVKILGVYPPGMVMRLNNGEIAVVTHRGQNTAAPIVQAFCGPRGAPLDAPIVRDIKREAYGLRESLHHRDYVEAITNVRVQLWDFNRRRKSPHSR